MFLLKPQTLFGLPSGDREIFNLLERLRTGTQELPPGCEVTYELEAVDILKSLLRRSASQDDALERYYRDFKTLHGVRPTAVEVYQDGYNPRSVRERAGSWMRFVASMGDLTRRSSARSTGTERSSTALDTTEMVKSYKMLVLLAMLNADRFPARSASTSWPTRSSGSRLGRRGQVRILGSSLGDRKALDQAARAEPHRRMGRRKGHRRRLVLPYAGRHFQTTFDVEPGDGAALQELVRELAEWRLDRVSRSGADADGGILDAEGEPRERQADPVPAAGARTKRSARRLDRRVRSTAQTYSANFVKIAINVVRKPGDDDNQLPEDPAKLVWAGRWRAGNTARGGACN